jgi:hypothetical protein
MAVAAAGGRSASEVSGQERDAVVDVGGVTGEIQRRRPSEVVEEAAQWLLRNHHRWETFVEDDKDVQGTAWEHMAYALGVQAVLRAGGSPYDQRLRRTWGLMSDLWDAEAGLWNEPGASGKRATIRAAFYTVCAYEEARRRIGQLSMAEQAEAERGPVTALDRAALKVRTVAIDAGGLEIVVSTDETSVACTVPERLLALALLLHDAAEGRAVAEIAASLHVAPSSVAKYVQRLNRAVAAAFGGATIKLVVACATAQGSGYALTVAGDGRLAQDCTPDGAA